MIDVLNEEILPLREAVKLPLFGKRLDLSTLYRWSTVGCRGIRLETVQVGPTRCTSKEALVRFIHALTEKAGLGKSPRHAPAPKDRAAAPEPVDVDRLPAHRRRQIQAAQQRLAASGV